MPAKQPIIVIKKVSGHGGHHGGAWKVAYADFVTAMMALFIVLWLLNSSVKVKKAVAGYFNDPKSSQKELGASAVDDDTNPAMPVDRKSAEKLKQQIEQAILHSKDLEKLAKQIEITITPEGLRIELIEDKKGTFFQSGSAQLSQNGQELLGMLAGQLKPLPNKLLLEGHTDAQPYSSDEGYTNWELSADRANAARRLLQQDGVGKSQISQVRGYADQFLRVKNDPMDPSNRRISLIVQWAEPGGGKAVGDGGKPTVATGSGIAVTPIGGAAGTGSGASRPMAAAAKPTVAIPVTDKAGAADRSKTMPPGGKAVKN
jgi:chemotaxis protein MotB